MDTRLGAVEWGGKRKRTSADNWRKPTIWNASAAKASVQRKVFCASLADVFDNKVPREWRDDLWSLIHATPSLSWLLLTKRPQNIVGFLPSLVTEPHVWLGATIENATEAARRIPHLQAAPAAVRFLPLPRRRSCRCRSPRR